MLPISERHSCKVVFMGNGGDRAFCFLSKAILKTQKLLGGFDSYRVDTQTFKGLQSRSLLSNKRFEFKRSKKIVHLRIHEFSVTEPIG